MKKIVVIPTYNESENIVELIARVLEQIVDLNVLIVDDNSPDGTSGLVRGLMQSDDRIHLIERPGKMGLGTAYCDGFRYSLQKGFDLIFEMDADFSHDPKDLPRFLKEIETHDLVIGSRYIKGVNVVNWPLGRLMLSYFASMYTRFVTGMPIMDTTAGFKCFRAEKLAQVDMKTIKSNGYGFQIEMNYRLWLNGARIKEIPIIFIDRRSGVSKMNRKIVWEALFIVWKLKWFGLFNKKRVR